MIERTSIVTIALAALAIGVMLVGSIRWMLAYIARGYGIAFGEGGMWKYGLDALFAQRADVSLPASAARQTAVTERTHV